MKSLFRPLLPVGLLVGVATLVASPAWAASPGTDNAANYSSSGWTNGSNQSTGGFGAWNLTNNNNNGSTAFAGYFLGDSTAGSGNINTNNVSFAIYANPSGSYAVAGRAFDSNLTAGQNFSIQLAVNFRNGGKGINLTDNTGSQVFNFNAGGDDYTYRNAGDSASTSLGFAYKSDAVFTLTYSQQTDATGAITLTQSSGGSVTGTFTETINSVDLTSFALYNSNTDNGDNANNLYFNNLSVTGVPEPATWLGGAALVLVGGLARRRQSRLA